MKQVADFFSGLFDHSLWPARWHCGYWTDFHGWLYIISDLLVWLSYFLIPLIIINFITKKKAALKFQTAYVYFAAFILLCGLTHFLDALMFWVPVYRLNALLRMFTAIVSLATVYHLIKILPVAFKQKTNTELEKEILRRREAEFRVAEANDGLTAFAYMASHDLKEPLRKVEMFTSMLREQNVSNYDAKSIELSEKIKNATGRMQGLIENILMLSTIPEEIHLEPVNMDSLMQTVISELDLLIKEKKARIQCDPLPEVRGNTVYLVQLFSNLVTNALKFTASDPVIHIYSTVEQQRARIHVKDNGIGMKEKWLPKIFNTFHRLHGRSEFEGSGIGLAICKKIATVLGGNIFAESKEGEGSVFTVELNRA